MSIDISKLMTALSPEKRLALGELLLRSVPGAPRFSTKEPVAIIGIGCRFPGEANDTDTFWQLLKEGRNAVGEIPQERWNIDDYYNPDPDVSGKMPTRQGGFLKRIDQFDADFFGISPREAVCMDPQQRLLLEVTWEALEDAGLVPLQLEKSQTGVFIGIGINDYSQIRRSDRTLDPRMLEMYAAAGNAFSIAANRISYLFNFHGPSLAIDTACSSSLVAVHLACQSLRSGESTLALVGGSNLMLQPENTIRLSKFLSQDGACKAFDARANGYVRGEGVGVVVLKLLARALADNDPIYAVIRSSATNQDGRSSGLTAPSGPAQESLIREALLHANIEPSQVGYVETHGTGTVLGDPIEANALGSVLAQGRSSNQYCAIGTVKSNIGHLEAAAGIAGLIKVALSLKNRHIPPSLHFETPNPNIPFARLFLRVQQHLAPWPEVFQPAIAGVSAFGFGGTNAHVILQEAPTLPTAAREPSRLPTDSEQAHTETRAVLLPLSARSQSALQQIARDIIPFLQQVDSHAYTLSDVCYTACLRRSHHPHRLALVGHSAAELAEQAQTFLLRAAAVSTRFPEPGPPSVVFIFSGQGNLWPGVARSLLTQEPFFARQIQQWDHLLTPLTGWSLLSLLTEQSESESRHLLARTEVAQPLLFALQMSLAALWQHWGIRPAAVIGHSVGEVAAAVVAGLLSAQDGLRLVVERGKLMQTLHGQGHMLGVNLSAEQISSQLAKLSLAESVSVASYNGPHSVVLSGSSSALQQVYERLEQQGYRVRWLPVDYAFHSRQVELLQAPLAERLGFLHPQEGALPLFSTLTGDLLPASHLDADYWSQQMREPVRFTQALSNATAQGYRCFLELGGHPTLLPAIEEHLAREGLHGLALPTFRKARGKDAALPDDQAELLRSLGALYTYGAEPGWEKLQIWPPTPAPQLVSFPRYPWQQQRYWIESSPFTEPTSAPVSETWRDWLYETLWMPQALQAHSAASLARHPTHWLLLADEQGIGSSLHAHWQRQGVPGILLHLPEKSPLSGWCDWWEYQWQQDALRSLLSSLRQDTDTALLGIVQLGGLDLSVSSSHTQDPQRISEALYQCWQSVYKCRESLSRLHPGVAARLWLITQGAQALPQQFPLPQEHLTDPLWVSTGTAVLWGLGRVLRLEHTDWWGGLYDLDTENMLSTSVAQLVAEFGQGSAEDQVGWRAQARYVQRVQSLPAVVASSPESWQLSRQGSYLITGGLGALGSKLTAWLIAAGARHLVLLTRRGEATLQNEGEIREQIAAWRIQGIEIQVEAIDVSERATLHSLLQRFGKQWPVLRGIIHAAGVSSPVPLAHLSEENWQQVTSAKLPGSWWLAELSEGQPLDFVLYCSSAASVWGVRNQGAYAGANALLDHLAYQQQRRHPECRVLSINWGPWQSGGMASEPIQQRLAQTGMLPLPAQETLEALSTILLRPRPASQIMIMRVEWDLFTASYEARGRRPIMELVRPEEDQQSMQESATLTALESTPMLQRLAAVGQQEQVSLLEEAIEREVREVLGHDQGSTLGYRQGFFEVGMDSLIAIELQKRLQEQMGRRLSSTLVFDHPTIERLARFLAHEFSGDQLPLPVSPPLSQDTQKAAILEEIEHISEEDAESLMKAELNNILKRM